MRFINNIKQGVTNFIYWIPVIWRDRNWDYVYIGKLLEHKLKSMEKFFASNKAMCLTSKEKSYEMRYVIELLNRLNDSIYYLDEAMRPFYEKYPDYKWEFEIDNNGKYISNDTAEQEKLKLNCYRIANRLEKEDYDELFLYLKNKLKGWWD